MKTRQIQLDDEANSILDALAANHDGDASVVVAELLHTNDTMESMLDDWNLKITPNLRGRSSNRSRTSARAVPLPGMT